MVNNALKLRKVKARKAHLGMYCGSLLEEDFSLTDRSDAACCVLRAACCVLFCVNQLHVSHVINMASECQSKNVRK
jgi:hypothetical protein